MNDNQTAVVLHTPKSMLEFLQRSESAIKMALPKHLNAERMMRLALTCFSSTPRLRECTANSILASVVVASQLGLEVGIRGQGYLIPYKNTRQNNYICTFVPGWQGLVGLLNNTGRATAWTGMVYEGDGFDFELGSAPRCRHIPGENFGDPEKMTWAYACGKVNGSEQPIIEAWPIKRVWKHRDRYNKVGGDHYSFKHPEMYARKVVLLQVLKYMPSSIELNNAITASDAAELGAPVEAKDGVIIEMDAVDADEKFTPRTATPTAEATAKTTVKAPAATVTPPAKSAEKAPENTPPVEVKNEPATEKAPVVEKAPVQAAADTTAKAAEVGAVPPILLLAVPPLAEDGSNKAEVEAVIDGKTKVIHDLLYANGATEAQFAGYIEKVFRIDKADGTIRGMIQTSPKRFGEKVLAKVYPDIVPKIAEIKTYPGASAV